VSVFNHVGQCVTDLERARRFYVELFDFAEIRTLQPPDEPSAKLLRLDPPLAMTALYLQRDGFVLELLHFAVVPRIAEYGGEVLADTDIGGGVFVRDPDGQLVELLPLAYAERIARGK
jgi:lactoylglutathione lyase